MSVCFICVCVCLSLAGGCRTLGKKGTTRPSEQARNAVFRLLIQEVRSRTTTSSEAPSVDTVRGGVGKRDASQVEGKEESDVSSDEGGVPSPARKRHHHHLDEEYVVVEGRDTGVGERVKTVATEEGEDEFLSSLESSTSSTPPRSSLSSPLTSRPEESLGQVESLTGALDSISSGSSQPVCGGLTHRRFGGATRRSMRRRRHLVGEKPYTSPPSPALSGQHNMEHSASKSGGISTPTPSGEFNQPPVSPPPSGSGVRTRRTSRRLSACRVRPEDEDHDDDFQLSVTMPSQRELGEQRGRDVEPSDRTSSVTSLARRVTRSHLVEQYQDDQEFQYLGSQKRISTRSLGGQEEDVWPSGRRKQDFQEALNELLGKS